MIFRYRDVMKEYSGTIGNTMARLFFGWNSGGKLCLLELTL